MGFDVVCGARTRLAPTDRLSNYINEEYTSLNLIKDLVITIVSKKMSNGYNITTRDYLYSNYKSYSNNIYDLLTTGIDIIDGFEYLGADAEPVPRMSEYFSATEDMPSDRPAGHTYTVRFLSPTRIYSVQC